MKFSTFPLRAFTVVDGRPTCNCSKGAECPTIGKHPACDWKTSDEPYAGVETRGVGIRTGTLSGIFVVDVDVRPEKGVDGFQELAQIGELPNTRIVVSPSGGAHFYFKLPHNLIIKNSGGTIAPGIDIRGDGGLVVAPHSPHKKGGYYRVENDAPIADAPDWLLERIRAVPETIGATPSTSVPAISRHHKEYGYRIALARGYLVAAPPCLSDGQSSSRLMSMASYMMVKLQLPMDKALELVQELFNPRCEPPWEEKDLVRALANAAESGMGIPGVAPEGFEFPITPREIQPAEDLPTPKRNIVSASHKYTFEVGQIANSKSRPVSLAEVVADLVQLEEWEGVLQYDEFGDKLIAINPPVRLEAERTSVTDGDINAIRCWFEVMAGKSISKDMMHDAVDMAAMKLKFHPVRDYLESLPTVNASYLDGFARHVFGQISDIQVDFLKIALVSAVKRVYEPGCFVKPMLVLYGEQNAGKSSFCKKLFGTKWFKEDISDLKSKDAVQELLGIWGVEMSEMDTISRAEQKTAKSFVSRAFDNFRPSYGRKAITRYRQNIFIGTTNEDDFLRDPTGATRYMPIQVCNNMPTDWERDDVWSAAYQLYRSGYICYLSSPEQNTAADEIRNDFTYEDPWTSHIEKLLMGKTRVSAQQIAILLIPEANQLDGRAMARIQATLKRVCGTSKRDGGRHDRTRFYTVPEKFHTHNGAKSPVDKNKPS